MRPIPPRAGIGLRPAHHSWVIEHRPAAAWLEVQPADFMSRHSSLTDLEVIATRYPLSIHGIDLSLGSVTLPHLEPLQRLRELLSRFEPDLVSDHLTWNRIDGIHLPDLLPLPYTEEALRCVIRNVNHAQDILRRQILLENPAKCPELPGSARSEAQFLSEVVLRTGCGVLLEVNGTESLVEFLNEIPPESIGEIHIAGHGAQVQADIWRQYEVAISYLGALPTLIEWDTRIPGFEVLQQEAVAADEILWGRSNEEARRAAVG